jgi:RNA polymerase sigma-70 factor (ECF subfamily)
VTDRQADDQSAAVRAAQARTGMAADFTSVFAEQLGYVVRSLRRLGVPERDLEDVAHDTFIVVHRKLPEYDTSRPLRPFLFGIAYRVASDYRRRARHRYERLVDPPTPPHAASSPEQALDVAQHQRLVIAALQGLDPERCAVFVMMDIDGHAAPEVATALAIPLNTVYSRLRIARGEFAAAVQRLQHRGGRR